MVRQWQITVSCGSLYLRIYGTVGCQRRCVATAQPIVCYPFVVSRATNASRHRRLHRPRHGKTANAYCSLFFEHSKPRGYDQDTVSTNCSGRPPLVRPATDNPVFCRFTALPSSNLPLVSQHSALNLRSGTIAPPCGGHEPQPISVAGRKAPTTLPFYVLTEVQSGICQSQHPHYDHSYPGR